MTINKNTQLQYIIHYVIQWGYIMFHVFNLYKYTIMVEMDHLLYIFRVIVFIGDLAN